MTHGIFKTLFFIPLYNSLIWLIDFFPGYSAGLAVIALTVIIKLILFPLSRKAIKTQLGMKEIEPEMQKIRDTVKDKQEQTRQILKLYKDHDINPFASFFLVLIQFPILIALYQVFRSSLPSVDAMLLYSFIPTPHIVNMSFLGINLMQKSIVLAALTVITQFVQLNISLPKAQKPEKSTLQGDLAYNMNMQMKYIFPLILFPIAYISAVIGLYLLTSNIFTIFQELFVRRKLVARYART